MQPGEIREHLVDRLTAIFGAPKSPDGLSAELAKHVPLMATPADLDGVADRLIATRKTKGFPAAGELIAAVRAMLATGHPQGTAPGAIPGEIFFDGEIPMVWVFADDPRWGELCKIAVAIEPRNKQGKPSRPYPMTSKYASGMGRFFRAAHVRGIAITDAERAHIASLYATARVTPGPTAPVEA